MGSGGFIVFVSFFILGAHESLAGSGFGLKRPRDGATDLSLIRQAGGARERTLDHWVQGELLMNYTKGKPCKLHNFQTL